MYLNEKYTAARPYRGSQLIETEHRSDDCLEMDSEHGRDMNDVTAHKKAGNS